MQVSQALGSFAMGNSMSLRDVVHSRSQREASDKSQSPSSKGGSKRRGSKKRLVFNFTDVSELDDVLEEIELALNDVLENKVVKRKTSEALQTNLNDVGTMLDPLSSKCQEAKSQVDE